MHKIVSPASVNVTGEERKSNSAGRKERTASVAGRIRLLYLIPSLQMGGAEIQLLSLVKGLDKSRFDPTVAVLYDKGELKDEYRAIPQVRIVFLGKKSIFDFTFLPRLGKLVRRYGFDIVCPYNVSARFFGFLAAKLYGIKYTVMAERNSRAVYSSMGSRVYHALERLILPYATVVVSNSKAGRQFAISRGVRPEKVRVILNGIDDSRLQVEKSRQEIRKEWGISTDNYVVGMVARMFPQKDHATFLRAAKIVVGQLKEVRFLLVGDGPIFGRVRQMAQELGLSQHVVFTGAQSKAADFIRAMDVIVLTSKTAEGHSNALIEAGMLGIPIIATNVPGNDELVENNATGLLVQPQNPVELAEKIMLMSHPRQRQQMGAKAERIFERRFSRQRMVESYQEIYEKLIEVGSLHGHC